MPMRRKPKSLRHRLVLGALLVVVAVSVAMLGSVSVVLKQQDDIARDIEAQREEQRIAEQIVALTYEQQLAAYRFLQRPDSSYLTLFREQGRQAYAQISSYLFRDLSSDARLKVEQVKEVHQRFEVAAQRAFDLALRGESEAARRRLAGLDAHTAQLDTAVKQLLEARARQRAAFRDEQRRRAEWLQIALATLAGVLVVLVLLLSRHLRRRVLVPLEQLGNAASRLGSGDEHARVPPQSYAEFDALATGFNQMADSLQTSRETLAAQNEELQQTLDHLHQTLEHLQQTESELVQHEKLSAMGQMLAGLAHELNNPLAGVLGMAEGLRHELTESAEPAVRKLGHELAEPLEREALRAVAIVRNLLDFARKPSGEMERVVLASAVGTAVGLRAHAFALAGKTLEVDVPSSAIVIADAQKLQHCIVNLVNNALDAVVAADGRGLRITATTEGDDFVRVDFDDDGTGFEDPIAAFAPFYTTKPVGKGTGLGLALVQRFVAEFGGTVTASNRAAGGARITMRLRAAHDAGVATGGSASSPDASRVAPARDRAAASPRPSTRATDEAATAAAASSRLRVLVVDDEPALREVQRRLLIRAGFDVALAASGIEARDLVRRERFDLVISDLRMPGEMDGREFLDWLEREHPALAARTLLATGDMSGDADGALPVHEHRVLSKPFNAQEYIARVRRALDLTV